MACANLTLNKTTSDFLPEPFKMSKSRPPSEDMKKVLVLYFGGCLGYSVDPAQPSGGLIHMKNKLRDHCRNDPSLNDINFLSPFSVETNSFCVLPSDDPRADRIAYLIYEYDKLFDSFNLTLAHWKILAKDIQSNYEDFDGFVVIHGEDTMVYTACALSFMFENLSKCVVITGALKPIFDSRSDAKSNLKTSILVAGSFRIPEVTIFCRDRLLRGNRAIKRSPDHPFSFDSLNVPPLLLIGSYTKENYNNLPSTHKKCKLSVHTKLISNVSFIRMYPGLPIQVIKSCFESPMEGVVMQTYGSGNIPTESPDLHRIMKEAVERGAIVVNCTQCPVGGVVPVRNLGAGQIMEDLGIIYLSDITVEAAITKLMYVLSKKKLSLDEKKKMMAKPIRGELTEIV